VLGEIHKMYKPVFGRMKDYIAAPKPNGYKSLHTTLITKDGTPFEVQIRTYEMHEYNQYGIASHWRYKQGDKPSDIIDEKLNWIRSIIEDEKQIRDSENFIKALQMDFSTSEIWVFTPKLKPISLPEKATPIDMAYAVHTDLGNTCVGAKVNDKKVPLTYKLDTGDVVEIITSKQSKGPSREWLKIAVSTNARSHIRNFFKKSIKPENVRIGKQILEFKAEEQNVPIGSCLSNATLEQIKSKYLIYSLDDMFASIATGSLRAIDIINIARVKEKSSVKEKARAQSPVLIEGSEVEGVKFAHCCNPIPGDGIYAISSNSGITIHCEDCVNLKTVDKDRLLVAEWKAQDEHKLFDGSLRICGVDKVGVLNEVIGVLYTQGIIFTNISAKTVNEKKFEILVQIKVKDKKQLESLCSQIEKIECVEFVNRNNLN